MEKLISLLNKGDNSFETGVEVMKELKLLFNSFTSYCKLMSEIDSNLSKKGKNRLFGIICIISLSYAHERAQRGHDTMDLRHKASESFAYQNECFFERAFHNIYNFIPSRDKGHEWFSCSIDRREFKECAYLLGALSVWTNTHSTTKQSIYGGYVKGIIIPEYSKGFPFAKPYGCDDYSFAFI